MGGCRCSFRNCEKSTSIQKNAHFFHYPHKDMERAAKWADFGQTSQFLRLTPEKLRNKVVCGMHFKFSMFMNAKMDRLIKPAVPTLLYTAFGGRVDLEDFFLPELNYFTTMEELENLSIKLYEDPRLERVIEAPDQLIVMHPIPTSPVQPMLHNSILLASHSNQKDEIMLDLKIAQVNHMMDGAKTLSAIEPASTPARLMPVNPPNFIKRKIKVLSSTSQPPRKRVVVQRFEPIEDDESQQRAVDAITQSIEESQPNEFQELIELPEYKVLSSNKNSFNEISSTEFEEGRRQEQMNKEMHELKVALENQVHGCEEFKQFLDDKLVTFEAVTTTMTHQTDSTQKKLDDMRRILLTTQEQLMLLSREQKNQHEQTLETIQEKLSQHSIVQQPATSSSGRESPKLEKNSMKKMQLFNGIKRYLNPAAVALLRMEMFGSVERAYKGDEKNFAGELLNLGDEVYDYFTEEWRFRLPPKQAVKTWIEESANEYEEDL